MDIGAKDLIMVSRIRGDFRRSRVYMKNPETRLAPGVRDFSIGCHSVSACLGQPGTFLGISHFRWETQNDKELSGISRSEFFSPGHP